MSRGPVRFVVNGHLHQYRRTVVDGVTYVWAPSCAFPADTVLPGGDTTLGWLRWQLDGDDFDFEVVHDDSLQSQDLQALRRGHSFLYQTPPWPPDPADLA